MNRQFSFECVNAYFDEAQYLKLQDLVAEAAGLVGDGQGGELGGNPEYERGVAELICRAAGLPGAHVGEFLDEIHAAAMAGEH